MRRAKVSLVIPIARRLQAALTSSEFAMGRAFFTTIQMLDILSP